MSLKEQSTPSTGFASFEGTGRIPFPAYRGNEAYIFISYAHVDAQPVYKEITKFYRQGYHVWYDEGISPGNEWTDEIAEALAKCALFVVFFTQRSADSRNVQNEINFAINKNIPFLAIHLEPTVLSPGIELRIGTKQAILKYNMSEEEYHYKYTTAFARLGLECGKRIDDPKTDLKLPVTEELKPIVRQILTTTSTQNYAVGSTIRFGNYEWLVLDVQDGKALVITKKIIICRAYDTDQNPAGYLGGVPPNVAVGVAYKSVNESSMNTYLDYTLRGSSSFSDIERKQMESFCIMDHDQRRTTIYPRIYLLSALEMKSYFPDQDNRIAYFEGVPCRWWLRGNKLNEYSDCATFVDESGNIISGNIEEQYGVRPAMWIKLDETDSAQNGNSNQYGNTMGNLMNGGNMVYDNGFIYTFFYMLGHFEKIGICKIDVKTNEVTQVTNFDTSMLNVMSGYIFAASCRFDNPGIFKISLSDFRDIKQLTKERIFLMVMNNQYIFVSTGYAIFRMDINGENTITINQNINAVTLFIVNNYLYFTSDGELYRCNFDGDKTEKLSSSNEFEINYITTDGNNLFFNTSNTNGLFSANPDFDKIVKIAELTNIVFNIIGDYIFYWTSTTFHGKAAIYRINKDGSDEKKIDNISTNVFELGDKIYYCLGRDHLKQMERDGSDIRDLLIK